MSFFLPFNELPLSNSCTSGAYIRFVLLTLAWLFNLIQLCKLRAPVLGTGWQEVSTAPAHAPFSFGSNLESLKRNASCKSAHSHSDYACSMLGSDGPSYNNYPGKMKIPAGLDLPSDDKKQPLQNQSGWAGLSWGLFGVHHHWFLFFCHPILKLP